MATVDECLALLWRILALYERRYDSFAEAIRLEMGAPRTFAHAGQAARGPAHLKAIIQVLEDFPFKIQRGSTRVLLAEVLHDAGVPAGVFNLVNSDGEGAIAAYPDVDMVSFIGSARAGIAVAKLATDGVKRVAQELGGKISHLSLPVIVTLVCLLAVLVTYPWASLSFIIDVLATGFGIGFSLSVIYLLFTRFIWIG